MLFKLSLVFIIQSSVLRKKRIVKPFYELHIVRGSAITAFSDKVGFSAPEKLSKLAVAVAWINRPRQYFRSSEIAKHRKSGMSFSQIARTMGLAEGSHHRLAKIYQMSEQKWQQKSG
jgi:hypothetical protein